MNYIRPRTNFFHKVREDERTALGGGNIYGMSMTIAADSSMGSDYPPPMEDFKFVDVDCDNAGLPPPPLFGRQRSSSPRSVSGFWPNGFFRKESQVTTHADGNFNGDNDDFPDPLPLLTSASTDLINLMRDYFNNDIVREILPKTKLTLYTDREHKIEDIGMEEKDAEQKINQECLLRRRLLDEFPLATCDGDDDDPINFFAFANTSAEATHGVSEYMDNAFAEIEETTSETTKNSIKEKDGAKNKKKPRKSPSKKFTVSRGKTLASFKISPAAQKTKRRKLPTKRPSESKTVSRGKTSISIKMKSTARNAKAAKVATKKPTRKIKVVSRGGALASIKMSSAEKERASKATAPTEVDIETYHISKRNVKKNMTKKSTIVDETTIVENKMWNNNNGGHKTERAMPGIELVSDTGLTQGIVTETWNVNYLKLKAFYSRNGHSIVLRSDPDKKLAGWVKRQRNNMKLGRLSPKQIQRLDEIDFIWNRLEEAWFTKYTRLKKYVATYKRSMVSCKYDRSLAEWTQRQRREYHLQKPTMTSTRIKRLEDIPYWSWG